MSEEKRARLSTHIRLNSLASKALNDLAKRLCADYAKPLMMRCFRCKCEFDATLSDWKTQTCSNCYADSIRLGIVEVELIYHNWGEQNGGEVEMLERFEEGHARWKMDQTASR